MLGTRTVQSGQTTPRMKAESICWSDPLGLTRSFRDLFQSIMPTNNLGVICILLDPPPPPPPQGLAVHHRKSPQKTTETEAPSLDHCDTVSQGPVKRKVEAKPFIREFMRSRQLFFKHFEGGEIRFSWGSICFQWSKAANWNILGMFFGGCTQLLAFRDVHEVLKQVMQLQMCCCWSQITFQEHLSAKKTILIDLVSAHLTDFRNCFSETNPYFEVWQTKNRIR